MSSYYQDGLEITQKEFSRFTHSAINSSDQGGVFETVLLKKNCDPDLLKEHASRLQQGIEVLAAEFEFSLGNTVIQKILRQFKRQVKVITAALDSTTAVMRYQLVLNRNDRAVYNLIEIRRHHTVQYPIKLMLSDIQLPQNSNAGHIKSIDRRVYTESSLLLEETGYYDLLLRDSSGNIIEGSKTNVYAATAGVLYLPDADFCGVGVSGVMMKKILTTATKLGLEHKTVQLDQEQLLKSDVILVSNAVIGMQFVESVYDISEKRTNYRLKTESQIYQNLLKLQRLFDYFQG